MQVDEDKKIEQDLTINEEVRITEYAPSVFQTVKFMDGITPQMIKDSLSTEKNHKSVFKAKESAGKSGSFFFFSFDRKFIIKTMNSNEKKVFIEALPTYMHHLKQYPKSLIARIYGIFTVEMEDIQPVDLLLMANCAHTGSLIENVFDLKGSIINRNVEEWSENTDCLKDVNLLELVKEKKFLNFQRSDMRDIMKIMFKDIKYLNSRNLMDYSLLLIIENNPEAVEAKRKVSTVNNVRSFLRVSSELPEEDGEPTVRKMTEEDRKYWTQLTYVQIR
jgi:1-phosphatidylinositol-4-phosphate 5-kinase